MIFFRLLRDRHILVALALIALRNDEMKNNSEKNLNAVNIQVEEKYHLQQVEVFMSFIIVY